jgi:hypothetical protein
MPHGFREISDELDLAKTALEWASGWSAELPGASTKPKVTGSNPVGRIRANPPGKRVPPIGRRSLISENRRGHVLGHGEVRDKVEEARPVTYVRRDRARVSAWVRSRGPRGRLTLVAPVAESLGRGPLAEVGGLGRRPQRAAPFEAVGQQCLLFGRVRALAWSFIRVLLGGGWLAPPAFKEARMNNVVRNHP